MLVIDNHLVSRLVTLENVHAMSAYHASIGFAIGRPKAGFVRFMVVPIITDINLLILKTCLHFLRDWLGDAHAPFIRRRHLVVPDKVPFLRFLRNKTEHQS